MEEAKNTDDSSSLIQNAENEEEIKKWDVFYILPYEEEDQTEISKLLKLCTKFLKLVSYIITFVVVLSTAVLAKGSFLLMTGMVRSKRRLPVCIKGDDSSKEYELTVDRAETGAWIWCLYFVSVVPEALTLLRSVRICVFKSFSKPQLRTTWLLVFVFQTFHCIGFGLLVFFIFPNLYAVHSTMLTSCLCFLPSVLQLLSGRKSEKLISVKTILDSTAIFSQATGLVYFLVAREPSDNTDAHRWLTPLALFLTSFYWWENFIQPDSRFKCVQKLETIKRDLHQSRYFISIFVSLWKMVLTLATLLCVSPVPVKELFGRFKDGFENIPNNITRTLYSGDSSYPLPTETQADSIPSETILSHGWLPIYVALFHLLVGWICYIFAKFACRTCIQGFGFSLPLHLTTPICLFWMSLGCQQKLIDVCHASFFSHYVFWDCPSHDVSFHLFNLLGVLWLAWLLSQMWLTVHVWTPKSERLASTDKLFVNPMYCGALMDQSLLLNRRKYETGYEGEDTIKVRSSMPVEVDHFYENLSDDRISSDSLTRIYACATMWHETRDEMNQLLKSLFRMDEDQCARRNAMKFLRVMDVDYYEFEAHILFDDAFEDDDDGPVINQFVRLLIKEIDTAASMVHECHIQLPPPKVIPTPYGGKLIWTMPGKNNLVVHLKDKSKIRHKKRWSQVMYMYYLLGFGIMELKTDSNRKSVRAENTYILALDGDINFRPYAVQLLVDLMKKNPVLGAACGRIHPVGTGPLVWYQMFEYAIGHWLQKATEHMIGCVLCSPGCFSLFRAKALMDDNVMRKYTTMSEEARHYVQYDQGEDRWLCTLLLQRGYRVEYCAASDAYTHCPEGFGEFYNQRRRWAPSTLANIMDLLTDYKRIVFVNDNISMAYIIYQLMLMVGSILGPSTIFLMLVGAMVAAFRIPTVQALLANLIPIVFFILVCFFTKNDFQILIAQIVSALYALLMMAVLVGTAVQLVEDGPASPSAIFLLTLTSSFVISALLHPQELFCLFHGVLYFLSVPSMYLFLFLYSIINLNNVSWGTREIQKKTKTTLEEQQTQIKKMKSNSALDWLANFGFGKESREEDGGITCSLSNFFKCMFCTYPKDSDGKYQLLMITDKLDSINKQLTTLEKNSDKPKVSAFRRKSSLGKKMISFKEEEEDETETEDCYEEPTAQDEYNFNFNTTNKTFDEKRDDLINPYWMDDDDLRYGQVQFAEDSEINFWSDLIQKYLFPIEQNKAHQDKVAFELKELRNKVVFAFLMINSLFILAVFLLQVNKKNLHLKWPLGIKYSITYVVSSRQVRIQEHSLEIDPIGIVFVSFFAIILIIQFVGMLFHRLATITHILASEELRCCLRKFENISDQAHFDRNAVQIAREIQKIQGINGSDHIIKEEEKFIERRNTIVALENRQNESRKKKIKTLDDAFIKRYSCISENTRQDSPLLKNLRRLSGRRETLKILEDRRNSVLREFKRKSTIAREANELLDEDESVLKLMKAFSQVNGKLPPSIDGIENTAFEEENF